MFDVFIGRIINRFSKDIASIDEKLSETTYSFTEVIVTSLRLIKRNPSLNPSLISTGILLLNCSDQGKHDEIGAVARGLCADIFRKEGSGS